MAFNWSQCDGTRRISSSLSEMTIIVFTGKLMAIELASLSSQVSCTWDSRWAGVSSCSYSIYNIFAVLVKMLQNVRLKHDYFVCGVCLICTSELQDIKGTVHPMLKCCVDHETWGVKDCLWVKLFFFFIKLAICVWTPADIRPLLQMHKWVNAANPCNWSWICFQGSSGICDENTLD